MAGRDVFSIVLVRTFLSLWNVFNQSDINRKKRKKKFGERKWNDVVTRVATCGVAEFVQVHSLFEPWPMFWLP